jgi:hypothetical protein
MSMVEKMFYRKITEKMFITEKMMCHSRKNVLPEINPYPLVKLKNLTVPESDILAVFLAVYS